MSVDDFTNHYYISLHSRCEDLMRQPWTIKSPDIWRAVIKDAATYWGTYCGVNMDVIEAVYKYSILALSIDGVSFLKKERMAKEGRLV